VTAPTERLVIVTGAAGGIGSAVSREVIGAGMRVVGLDSDRDGLQQLQAEMPAGRFTALTVDLRDAEQTSVALHDVGARLGPIGGLVNAAGVISRRTIRELDVAEWDRVLDINLRAAFVTARACVPYMRAGAVIVNVTSIQATIANGDLPHYAASKGGLAQLTKSLAVALAPDGIRVVDVAPGTTDTPLNAARRQDPDTAAAYLRRIPLGRLVDVVDVARTVIFLLSPAARSITGTSVVVDGGLLATR
jgi:NAD(P)-dependent dehydrogenase (short-subunit alcohol dehydrogenase family)